jgi:TolB-like protein/class 3 adenylate cyclase/dienelactone hydrolase
MRETRKVAAILVADVVGFSRLAGADEERTLARLRALRSDLIDPTIALHDGRLVKRTGDGAVVEFRSVVEAVRSAIEVQTGLAERNAGVPANKRIEARVGIHLGDVVEEADGDLMGDGVNVAARLQAICEPGGVCLSEDAYRQVRDKLQVAFADLGEQKLKNIARPVRAYALKLGVAIDTSAVPRNARSKAAVWAALAIAFVAVLMGAGWFGWRTFAPPPPTSPPVAAAADAKLAHAPRLSIVVLPFANLSGDPEQEYFADGLTDDLTTDLSHLPDSFVIGRSTAAVYKGKPVDLKQLGRDLGVRYAVEGSVRHVGDAITINSQLISTETGAHVWADRFQGDRSKLGELQVEAVGRIANALGVQLINAEALRAQRERPTNPDATDLVMRGFSALRGASFSQKDLERAVESFDQALQLDPDNPQALAGKAMAQIPLSMAFNRTNFANALNDGEKAADQLLAAHPDNVWGHYVKGVVARSRGTFHLDTKFDAALTQFQSAIAADPNFAPAYADMGDTLVLSGRAEDAIEPIDKALRLDPHDSGRFMPEYYMCDAYAHMAKWEQTATWCERSIGSSPKFELPYYDLAAAYGWLGRTAEASAAIAEIKKLNPEITIHEYLYRVWRPRSGNETWRIEDQRIAEGLQKAGVPVEAAIGAGNAPAPVVVRALPANAMIIPVDDPAVKSIEGTLFKPSGAGPFPAVVYLFGCWESGIGPEMAMQKIAKDHLIADGFAILIVDPLAPRSGRTMEDYCSSITPDTLADYAPRGAGNALAAAKALKSTPGIDPNRIFFQGYAFGANAALFAVDKYAAAKHDPATMVAGVIAYYPLCTGKMDPTVPTLMIVGEKDDWMPAAACQAMMEDRPGIALVVYPGETHAFAMPYTPAEYQGHRMQYDEGAAKDAERRADVFIAAQMK